MSLVLNYQKRQGREEELSCFVIMPFNQQRNTVYNVAIRPAIENCGLRCIRADECLSPTPILFDIYNAILSSRVVLADVSEVNANVYYELGIAHALKEHVILICEENVKLPFDISVIRHIKYNFGMGADVALRNELEQALRFVLAEPAKRLREYREIIDRAREIWSKSSSGIPGEIIMSLEQYIETVFFWDELDLSEEEAAYLTHVSAYYGKLMRAVAERVRTNELAISALVVEAASGTFIRVPWRAAAMLEHMDPVIVTEKCHNYTYAIRNPDIFPVAILSGTTRELLKDMISKADIDSGDRHKLKSVLKQIEAEFGAQ